MPHPVSENHCELPKSWEVPEFTACTFQGRRHGYALCVFVLNEGERIREQLRRMQKCCDDVDIIIADGGSTDNGVEPQYLRGMGVNTLLVKTGSGKLGAQMRMAFAYCLSRNYDGIIVMDGNNKDDPRAISRFVSALDASHDHVQGSRFAPGGRAVRTPWMRWLGIRLVHAPLLSIAAAHRYTDTTNGFRAYSRQFLLDERVAPMRSCFDGYELHYYLAVRAARLGYRVTEVPVTRSYPENGSVPTKIHGFRANWSVLRKMWQVCRNRFDPPSNTSRAA